MPTKLFEKGKSGNPNGRPKISPEFKGLLKLKQAEILHILASYSKMSVNELEIAVENKALPAFEIAVGRAILKAIEHGDTHRLEWLLLRSIGKVKEQVEISSPKPYVIEKLNGEQVVLGSEIQNDEEEYVL